MKILYPRVTTSHILFEKKTFFVYKLTAFLARLVIAKHQFIDAKMMSIVGKYIKQAYQNLAPSPLSPSIEPQPKKKY